MGVQFKKAIKGQSFLRMALMGPSGAGKTYSALSIAASLADGKPVAVIDTERGSASKYADIFAFDVLELDSFHPDRYIEAIQVAAQAGYGVVVIDSITHEWRGKDGILEQVDKISQMNKTPSIQAWAKATPLHNRFVDAMLTAPLHVIVTMRSKMGVSVDKDERGKTTVSKVGMEAEQRDGIEYEFDVIGDLDRMNTMVVSKSRCPALSGAVIAKPGAQVADTLIQWLRGEPVERPAAPLTPTTAITVAQPATTTARQVATPKTTAKPIATPAVATSEPLPTWSKVRIMALEAGYKYDADYAQMLRDATGKQAGLTDADKRRVLDYLDGKPTADDAPAVAYPGMVVVDPEVVEATA